HAQQKPSGADLLGCELLQCGLCLVPAAEHDKRMSQFREHAPLTWPVSSPAGEGERLVEMADRVFEGGALEAPVREPDVQYTGVLEQIVLQRNLERTVEQRVALLSVSPTVGDNGLRPERQRERGRVHMRLGDVERELRTLGGAHDVAAVEIPQGQAPGQQRQ